MKECNIFPECDGHIESILIGYDTVKVSFQTWDARKLVLIYQDVESVKEESAVFGDISTYTISIISDGTKKYEFFDPDDRLVLAIQAGSMKIFEVGENAQINSALFDVGYDYIGDQDCPWR